LVLWKPLPFRVSGNSFIVEVGEDVQLNLILKHLPINTSDQNILKDSAAYQHFLSGSPLLADRGMTNQRVRERLAPFCEVISPPHYKVKMSLTPEQSKLYRKRWKIETLFKALKDPYSSTCLILKGKYTKTLKIAKFFTASLLYNASII
jgi:hypothetical protein